MKRRSRRGRNRFSEAWRGLRKGIKRVSIPFRSARVERQHRRESGVYTLTPQGRFRLLIPWKNKTHCFFHSLKRGGVMFRAGEAIHSSIFNSAGHNMEINSHWLSCFLSFALPFSLFLLNYRRLKLLIIFVYFDCLLFPSLLLVFRFFWSSFVFFLTFFLLLLNYKRLKLYLIFSVIWLSFVSFIPSRFCYFDCLLFSSFLFSLNNL